MESLSSISFVLFIGSDSKLTMLTPDRNLWVRILRQSCSPPGSRLLHPRANLLRRCEWTINFGGLHNVSSLAAHTPGIYLLFYVLEIVL